MDFGTSFLSNNVMLPILDFFYGIVPSYGLAIVAMTLVVRFALYPLSAGSIRSMRRTRVTQPIMQKRVKEIQERYKDDPAKQQEEMGKLYKEFGNPLAGCLPILLQMPILLALFATLRGSPFSDVNYTVNLQILPKEQIEQIQPQVFTTKPQNVYLSEGLHQQITALVPSGNRLVVGQTTQLQFQDVQGKPFSDLISEYSASTLTPHWTVIKGEERVKIDQNGNLEALQPGDVILKGSIPGLASDKGFLFIDALGHVGAVDKDGTIHWDVVAMIMFFGLTLYFNQLLAGPPSSGASNPQQDTVNKITPFILCGVFLISPLPSGVLMYMVIANIFQTAQSFILSREPLPENLQKLVEAQEKEANAKIRESLPFERNRSKKKTSG